MIAYKRRLFQCRKPSKTQTPLLPSLPKISLPKVKFRLQKFSFGGGGEEPPLPHPPPQLSKTRGETIFCEKKSTSLGQIETKINLYGRPIVF